MIIRLLAMLMLFMLPASAQAKAAVGASADSVLLFHYSTGYRHASIPVAVKAIAKLAKAEGLKPVESGDPAIFYSDLSRFAAIVLVSTTTIPKEVNSEWFVGDRMENLWAYLEQGGGIVGIHAAADSHYNRPFYSQMIGGQFMRHPPGTPEARVVASGQYHPASAKLPAEFTIEDEWYYYHPKPAGVTMLLSFDPASIGEPQRELQPLAWAHEYRGGRVFYTGLGHRTESWSNKLVLRHVRAGLKWAARK